MILKLNLSLQEVELQHGIEKLLSKEEKPAGKDAAEKAEAPAAAPKAEAEKKNRGGVEIFADDFEDDEA